jgi:hypothetical protein
LPEEVPVFQLDLGRVDVLLAASDFYAVVAESDYSLVPGEGSPRLVAKGESHPCLQLETLFEGLCAPGEGAEAGESTVFLSRREGRGTRAFVVGRPFELRSLQLRDFRLLPRGLRARAASRGMAALRFEEGRRLQILMNPWALGQAMDEGGRASRSS